jgi:Predicted acyl-CoA transferases/carnitine dehydratase
MNGGKRDVILDLKLGEDKEKLLALLKKADVFITNTRPQALERLQLTYDDLKERFPKLVYALVMGYGEKGPKAAAPGFDSVAFWSDTGFLQDMSVPVEGGYPVYIPMAVGDICCGTALAGAISTALFNRTRTGKGDFVSVSLYGMGLWAMSVMTTPTQYGYPWPRGRYQGSPMGVPLKCKDGKWVLPVVEAYNKCWADFCRALGAVDMIDDPKCNTLQATFIPENREYAVKKMEHYASLKTSAEIDEALTKYDIIHTVMVKMQDVHTSEQALANGFLVPHTYPSGKSITMATPGLQFRSLDEPQYAQAPALGADNEDVFREFDIK